MYELYFVSALLILIILTGDFFYTTVSFNGAGILSRNISWGIATFFLWIHKKTKNRTLLLFSGMAHILALMVCWIGLLWGAVFLLLMSAPDSIINPSTGLSATWLSKVYVSGYTLSTLGVGDYVAGSEVWEVVLAVFSFTGFIFITTAMAYLMSLTNAVIHKRNLSLFIANLGETPEEILINLYDYEGERFSILSDVSTKLREMINHHSQNHYAHPAVHYFYSVSMHESLSINLANLDEVLSILIHHVNPATWKEQDIHPLRDAITKFLNTASHHYHQKNVKITQRIPDLQQLKSNKIPLLQKPVISSDQNELAQRRSSLNGLLHSNGWNWNEIYFQQ